MTGKKLDDDFCYRCGQHIGTPLGVRDKGGHRHPDGECPMPSNVVQLNPPRAPAEWDEAFSVSVARNGQIFVTSADGLHYPEPLLWALSDLCKRMIEFATATAKTEEG